MAQYKICLLYTSSEESAAASEELSSQATLIKDLMNKFKLRNDSDEYSDLIVAGTAYQPREYSDHEAGAGNDFAKY